MSQLKETQFSNLLRQEEKGSVGTGRLYVLSLSHYSGHILSKFESCVHLDIQFSAKIVSCDRVSELIVSR